MAAVNFVLGFWNLLIRSGCTQTSQLTGVADPVAAALKLNDRAQLPSLVSSAVLVIAATVNGVSVKAYVPVTAEVFAWRLVPQATMPGAERRQRPTVEAAVPQGLLEVPMPAPGGAVATSLITIDEGLVRPENVLLSRSRCTDSETKPFGVRGQEQQERISSSGANAIGVHADGTADG